MLTISHKKEDKHLIDPLNERKLTSLSFSNGNICSSPFSMINIPKCAKPQFRQLLQIFIIYDMLWNSKIKKTKSWYIKNKNILHSLTWNKVVKLRSISLKILMGIGKKTKTKKASKPRFKWLIYWFQYLCMRGKFSNH